MISYEKDKPVEEHEKKFLTNSFLKNVKEMNRENKIILFIILLLFIPFFQKCIFYDRDGTKDNLGNGYYLYRTTGNSDIVGKKDIVLVTSIKDYANSDSFIIAYRNLNQMFYLRDSSDENWQEKNHNDSIQFWIINKYIDSLYGPYNKTEYLKFKKELKIPNSLKLNFLSE
ncbi:MAG: hypothetical protein ABI184_06940 [Ginsengibacter sp.]